MNKEEIAIIIGEKIKYFRKENRWTQQELGEKIGMSKNAIGNYEKGFRSPKKDTMFELANVFNVSIDDLFPPVEKTDHALETLTKNYTDLSKDGKTELVRYSGELLEAEKQATEISEPLPLYDVLVVSHTAAASGLGRGYGYDDSDIQTVQTDSKPPRHDIATEVSGDSMEPDYHDGDILYLVDKGLTTYSGDLAVVAYGDRSYFKKVYTEKDQLRLVSLNENYPDILLDFPPAENTHLKIFAVVGVLRKGERR